MLLRAIAPEDGGALHAYRGQDRVARFLAHPALDRAGTETLLAGWLADPTSVSVGAQLDGRLVGDVRLFLRPAQAKRPAGTQEVEGSLGYAFHPQVHGRGLATGCVRELVGTAFAAGVRRLTARVFAPAGPSSRVLSRAGFRREGVERAAVLAPDGSTWWDDEWWSLLAGDWHPPGQ